MLIPTYGGQNPQQFDIFLLIARYRNKYGTLTLLTPSNSCLYQIVFIKYQLLNLVRFYGICFKIILKWTLVKTSYKCDHSSCLRISSNIEGFLMQQRKFLLNKSRWFSDELKKVSTKRELVCRPDYITLRFITLHYIRRLFATVPWVLCGGMDVQTAITGPTQIGNEEWMGQCNPSSCREEGIFMQPVTPIQVSSYKRL
jgi:hypothetical protein